MRSGGFNFDAKVRRQSIDLEDLFYGHVNGIEMLAKALLDAALLIEQGTLDAFFKTRYHGWSQGLGKKIFDKQTTFEEIAGEARKHALNPKPKSGRQEWLEGVLHKFSNS